MTDLGNVDFACNYEVSCPYAMQCISDNCGDECNLCSTESDMELLIENHNTVCLPFILDICINDDGYFFRYKCEDNALTIFEHDEPGCGNPAIDIRIIVDEDTRCKPDFFDTYSYSTLDCNP